MIQLLTVEQLFTLIHKSPSSIRSDITRNISSLPPSFDIPSSRRRSFKDIDLWFESLINDQSNEVKLPARARRGRPTKSEHKQRLRTCTMATSRLGGCSCQ